MAACITVPGVTGQVPGPNEIANKKSSRSFHRAMESLLLSGQYSDLTISSTKMDFRVHKAIVCPRSVFFEKACSNPAYEESETGVIKLHNEDPDCVKYLVDFFYKLDYLEQDFKAGSVSKHLVTHVKMYELGERFGMQDLKDAAVAKFERDCYASIDLDLFCEAAILATVKIPEHDRNMHDTIIKTIVQHGKLCWYPRFKTLLANYPQVAVESFLAYVASDGYKGVRAVKAAK